MIHLLEFVHITEFSTRNIQSFVILCIVHIKLYNMIHSLKLNLLIILICISLSATQKTKIIEAFSESEVDTNVDVTKTSSEMCSENENLSHNELDKRPEIIGSSSMKNDFYYKPNFRNYYKPISAQLYENLASSDTNFDGSINILKNRIPPVTYLPPVYPPFQDNMLSQKVESESLINEDVRPPRVYRSEKDFWKQLQHDSIMKNILPTMPIPFYRNIEVDAPEASDLYYIPMLLVCSPRIIYGRSLNNNDQGFPISYLSQNAGYV